MENFNTKERRATSIQNESKLNDICFETKSLPWANPNLNFFRSITTIKPFHGATDFVMMKDWQNPKDFKSKDQVDQFIEDESIAVPADGEHLLN